MTKTRKKIFRLRDIPVADKAGKIFGTATRSADEKECATILAKFGYDVFFKNESKIFGVHTADILWESDGNSWEIKTIYGNRYVTIKHALDSAKKQSPHIILYAEKTKRSVCQVAKDCIKYCYAMPTKVIIEVLLITKKQYLHLTKNELYL